MSSGIVVVGGVVRRMVRAGCIAVAALACVSATPKAAPQVRRPDAGSAAAHSAPEVRLRKLHFVRPDLIPYPVAYEVYC